MFEETAEIAPAAVDDVEGLVALSWAYAHFDPSWRRAMETLRHAGTVYPGHPLVVEAYRELQEERRTQ